MKRFLVPMLILFLSIAAKAQNAADRIIGIWTNEDKTSKVEIFKAGDTYYGKIVWLAKELDAEGKPFLDRQNPDVRKRNQPIMGSTIISGLKFKDNKWRNGTIYAPKRGQYADCMIEIIEPNRILITVSKGMLAKTKIWQRQ